MVLRLIAAAGATGSRRVLMSTDAHGRRGRRRAGPRPAAVGRGPRWPSVEFVELDALTGTADGHPLAGRRHARARGRGDRAARRRRHRAGGVGDERRRRRSCRCPPAPTTRSRRCGRRPSRAPRPGCSPPDGWPRRRHLPRQGAAGRGRAGRGDRARRRLRLDRGARRLEGAVAARHPARGLLRVRRAARHRPVEHRRAAAPDRSHRPRRRRRAARPAPHAPQTVLAPIAPGRGRADRDPRRRPAAGRGTPHGRGRARHRRRRRRARGRVLARHPRHRHARARRTPRARRARACSRQPHGSGCSSRRSRRSR